VNIQKEKGEWEGVVIWKGSEAERQKKT
jgi:hypothetical protein